MPPKIAKPFWIPILALLGISALAYLPMAHRFGYLNDDWYLMYDAYSQGPQFFKEVFRSDRPARAYVLGSLFPVFGMNPLYYNLSAYLFRFLAGVCLYWTLKLLWPQKGTFASLTAILFTIYPGFLSQPNAIDYQSQMVGLWAAMLSLALTVKAVLAKHAWMKVGLIAATVLLSWVYLGLVEYFFGFEILRVAIVFLLVWRASEGRAWKKALASIRAWLPFGLAPVGFMFWRLFLYESTRRATDIGIQVGQLFSSPLVGLWWLVYLARDMFNVLLVAWGHPLYVLAFQLRLRDALVGFGLATLAVVLLWIGIRWRQENESEAETGENPDWKREAYWVGFSAMVGGLLPVIAANRYIVFPDYSRYTLAASLGAVILLTAVIEGLPSRPLRMTLAGLLVFVSALTHHANSVKAASDTDTIRNFWWQVVWRAPGIDQGTTLVAEYPGVGIQEDYFVWGPANLIYYPEEQQQTPIEIKLPAAVLTKNVAQSIMIGKGAESQERRGNIVTRNYGNILYMVQASPADCVRIMDGNAPDLSSQDDYRTLAVAPHSRIENVIVDAAPPAPPELVFGAEPPHGWCYYYQRASLARQQGNWEVIPMLHKEALQQGHYPNDSVEWLPFLQAYTALGNMDKLREFKPIILADPFLAMQTCQVLTAMSEAYLIDPDIQTYIQNSFCE
jgi:hypothetical protein